MPAEHAYAGDIDLFGRASIYQYINRCTSEQSKKLLASLLLQLSEKEAVNERQQAAKQLSLHTEWRQQLQSAGMVNPLTVLTEEKITAWLVMPDPLPAIFWKVVPNIFTAITLTCFAAYLFDWLSSSVFTLLVFVFFLFAKYTSARVNKTYAALSKIEIEVKTIYEQLKLVENMPAAASLLDSYKKLLVSERNGTQSG